MDKEYLDTLQFLFAQLPMYQRIGSAAYKANLDNTHRLDNFFNHPHQSFRSVHIAGTNGKGSVSHMIASVMQEEGYKTGLYTSPHLKDFRERIRINGNVIEKQEVIDFVRNNQNLLLEVQPSFFEMTVAMAFDYFARMKVDIAIIETGMGGRLDSTNIITPEVSVITNIGFDHTAFLGSTLAEIAGEKAGIIKNGAPLVVGEMKTETGTVFREVCRLKRCELINAEKKYQIASIGSCPPCSRDYVVSGSNKLKDNRLTVDLLGDYQKGNIATALATLDKLSMLGWSVTGDAIQRGFMNIIRNTGLQGRWQILDTNPLIICDTGHNEDGIRAVMNQVSQMHYEKLHIVLGLVSDKKAANMLKHLPASATYYFTKASIPRAMSPEILAEEARLFNLNGNIYQDVASAVEASKEKANHNDLIFIGGSTFVVADIL